MEPDELELWTSTSRGIPPCHECPLAFAAEMRAENRCNGRPAGADEEEEEVDVTELGTGGTVTAEQRIEIIAPCGTCAHRQVCGLREKLERAREADVAMARLPDELKLEIRATVDCAFYSKERGTARANGAAGEPRLHAGRTWSPEQRAAAAERMRARRAASPA